MKQLQMTFSITTHILSYFRYFCVCVISLNGLLCFFRSIWAWYELIFDTKIPKIYSFDGPDHSFICSIFIRFIHCTWLLCASLQCVRNSRLDAVTSHELRGRKRRVDSGPASSLYGKTEKLFYVRSLHNRFLEKKM